MMISRTISHNSYVNVPPVSRSTAARIKAPFRRWMELRAWNYTGAGKREGGNRRGRDGRIEGPADSVTKGISRVRVSSTILPRRRQCLTRQLITISIEAHDTARTRKARLLRRLIGNFVVIAKIPARALSRFQSCGASIFFFSLPQTVFRATPLFF